MWSNTYLNARMIISTIMRLTFLFLLVLLLFQSLIKLKKRIFSFIHSFFLFIVLYNIKLLYCWLNMTLNASKYDGMRSNLREREIERERNKLEYKLILKTTLKWIDCVNKHKLNILYINREYDTEWNGILPTNPINVFFMRVWEWE